MKTFVHWRWLAIGSSCVGLIAGAGCAGSSSGTSMAPTSTATGSGGSAGSGGSGGAGGSLVTTVTTGTKGGAGNGGGGRATGGSGGSGGASSGLPVPPGPGNLPPPSGQMANLKVIPWAGFQGAVTYTFDDSQPSQIDHFADIQATGVPVTYYITTVNNWYAGYDAAWKEAFAKGNELG